MKKIITSYMILFILVLIFGVRYVNACATEMISISELATPIEYELVEEKEIEIPESTEHVIIIQEQIIQKKEYRYINGCPLNLELQQGIFDICEEKGISFELVMAIIMQESSFRPKVTGDGGYSKGLMQIQERYHSDTMKELGVTDLYDPIGNVDVGVEILRGYFEELDDVYHVLMRYNGGEPYATNMMKTGKVSDYAKEITERAIKYEEENGI